jgi:hypothetical protein
MQLAVTVYARPKFDVVAVSPAAAAVITIFIIVFYVENHCSIYFSVHSTVSP